MIKITFMLIFSFSSFALDCSFVTSQKSKEAARVLSFIEVQGSEPYVETLEFNFSSTVKLRVEYDQVELDDNGEQIIESRLTVLRHRGGNGYSVDYRGHFDMAPAYDGKVRFNFSYNFDDHSESIDYQLSEGVNSFRHVLECFIP